MPSFLLIAVLTICAAFDLRQLRIPNALTLGGFCSAGLYLLISGHSLLGASPSAALLSLVLALLLSLPAYGLGYLGAGDVKLLAMLGLASDSTFLLHSLIGAGLSYVLWALISQQFWPLLAAQWQSYLRHLAPARLRRYPYAPFVLIGAIAACL